MNLNYFKQQENGLNKNHSWHSIELNGPGFRGDRLLATPTLFTFHRRMKGFPWRFLFASFFLPLVAKEKEAKTGTFARFKCIPGQRPINHEHKSWKIKDFSTFMYLAGAPPCRFLAIAWMSFYRYMKRPEFAPLWFRGAESSPTISNEALAHCAECHECHKCQTVTNDHSHGPGPGDALIVSNCELVRTC